MSKVTKTTTEAVKWKSFRGRVSIKGSWREKEKVYSAINSSGGEEEEKEALKDREGHKY